MTDNTYFLKALLANNTQEIKAIYKTNFFKVKKFIIQNKGSQQDAEDIFQLALMQLAVRYKKEPFTINTSFNAYLFTVCKNLWRRELNKHKNKVTNYEVIELEDESTDMALSLLEQKRWELFNETLDLISENCKKILKLFFAKTPYSEIVKKMEYNSETVARQRIFKCKNGLTKLIKENKGYKSLTEL